MIIHDIFRMCVETKSMLKLLKFEHFHIFRIHANIYRILDSMFCIHDETFCMVTAKYIQPPISAHELFNRCRLSKPKLIAQTETLPRIFHSIDNHLHRAGYASINNRLTFIRVLKREKI